MMVHPPEGRIPNRTVSVLPIHTNDDNNNSNNTSDQQAVTVVVQLSGELGNQLQKITNGRCVQRLIENKLGLTTKLMLRAQNHGKWKNAMISVKEAFPNLRPFNFQEGNTKEFDVVHNQQQSWIQQLVKNNQLDLTNVSANADCLNGLKCAEENCYVDLLNLLNQTWHMVDRPSNMVKDGNISIPHVYVESFVDSYCLELLYDELVLQDFLTIDEKAICKQVPDSDESVFHYRNYIREMPRVGTRRGFEEADSNLTATKIFANYSRTTSPAGQGGRVAIISRFPDHVDEYIKAFQERGIEARRNRKLLVPPDPPLPFGQDIWAMPNEYDCIPCPRTKPERLVSIIRTIRTDTNNCEIEYGTKTTMLLLFNY
eukprot:scaffold918_cov126-Cylindrotheca_fusiformis.AAC.16